MWSDEDSWLMTDVLRVLVPADLLRFLHTLDEKISWSMETIFEPLHEYLYDLLCKRFKCMNVREEILTFTRAPCSSNSACFELHGAWWCRCSGHCWALITQAVSLSLAISLIAMWKHLIHASCILRPQLSTHICQCLQGLLSHPDEPLCQ